MDVLATCTNPSEESLSAMMGEPVGRQDRLFSEFDLEDMVPGDHLLRRIDAALDLSWLRWPR